MKRVIAKSTALLPLASLVPLVVAQAPPPAQAPPQPPTYSLTELGPLAITAAPSGPTAPSASGQVTGFRFENFTTSICLAAGTNEAFLWNDGAFTDLGTLSGASGAGYGINNSGQITGAADICLNQIHTFMAAMTPAKYPIQVFPLAIRDNPGGRGLDISEWIALPSC